jgi:hypothetical protein
MPNQTPPFSNSGKILPNFSPKILEKNAESKRHVKTITNSTDLRHKLFSTKVGAIDPQSPGRFR